MIANPLKITNICYKHQLNILHNNEFADFETNISLMRTELEGIFNDYFIRRSKI